LILKKTSRMKKRDSSTHGPQSKMKMMFGLYQRQQIKNLILMLLRFPMETRSLLFNKKKINHQTQSAQAQTGHVILNKRISLVTQLTTRCLTSELMKISRTPKHTSNNKRKSTDLGLQSKMLTVHGKYLSPSQMELTPTSL